MNVEKRRAYYIEALLQYIKMEYYLEPLPEEMTLEMISYLSECFDNLTCYPNAAGKFFELYKTQKEST